MTCVDAWTLCAAVGRSAFVVSPAHDVNVSWRLFVILVIQLMFVFSRCFVSLLPLWTTTCVHWGVMQSRNIVDFGAT